MGISAKSVLPHSGQHRYRSSFMAGLRSGDVVAVGVTAAGGVDGGFEDVADLVFEVVGEGDGDLPVVVGVLNAVGDAGLLQGEADAVDGGGSFGVGGGQDAVADAVGRRD